MSHSVNSFSGKRLKMSAGVQLVGEGGGGLQDVGLRLGEGLDLGDGLGRRLPGSPFLAFPPPPPCPSTPSEFSSISWMSGGMEPGISIFRVITRSAPEEQSQETCISNII